MIHIDWSGELVQIGGSVDDLGSDISRTLVSVLFGMMESGEYAEEELEAWVSSILVTAMDVANKERADVIVKAIKKGSALVQKYEEGLLSPSAWFVEEMAATS